MRLTKTFLLAVGTLSLVVACSSEDSLGKKKNGQGSAGSSGAAGSGGSAGGSAGSGGLHDCNAPDPSDGCDNGCPAGYTCDPSACRPSSCSCDPENGWACTADCGEGGTCMPDNGASCEDPDPSQNCDTTGCPQGLSCEPDQCKPSTCSCMSGSWACTFDCVEGTSCVEASKCEGPDPSQNCDTTGCPQGFSCEPDNCKPSTCGCGSSGWECTSDCGQGTSCVKQ